MADGRHIENRPLAISPRVIVRLKRNVVDWSRITVEHRPHYQDGEFRKFKMADGRHFENGFNAISQLRINRFGWSLVGRCRFWFQEESR